MPSSDVHAAAVAAAALPPGYPHAHARAHSRVQTARPLYAPCSAELCTQHQEVAPQYQEIVSQPPQVLPEQASGNDNGRNSGSGRRGRELGTDLSVGRNLSDEAAGSSDAAAARAKPPASSSFVSSLAKALHLKSKR